MPTTEFEFWESWYIADELKKVDLVRRLTFLGGKEMMDAEALVKALMDYVTSPRFLLLTKKQKNAVINFGLPAAAVIIASLHILEYTKKQLDLDKLNRDIEAAKLEKMWNKGD